MSKISAKEYRKLACLMISGQTPEIIFQSQDFWTLAQADAMFPILWSKLDMQQKEKVLPLLLFHISPQIQTADSLRMRNATLRVLRAFQQANIPVICMRGLTLSHKLYPEPHLRPFTDIDILIHTKDTLMAKQVIGNILHYNPVPAFPMLFKQGDIPLDLHIEPIGIERIKAWQHLTPLNTDDFFKHATKSELEGEEALLLQPYVLLPYLCFHAQKHSFERLIWLYDIKLLVEMINQDNGWDEVRKGIHEYQLERPCYYALSYLKAYMNSDIPEELLNSIKPDFGFIEKRLFTRFMSHEIVPYLAERLFARMLPSLMHQIEFWRETIYPDEQVRKQIAGSGCVKCNFIRTRLKQIATAIFSLSKELFLMVRS